MNCQWCNQELEKHGSGRLKCPTGETVFMQSVLETFDAQYWARVFVIAVSVKPKIATDQETMHTWFANALMRGYDEHYWRTSEYKRKVRRALHPWWSWRRYFETGVSLESGE